MKLYNRSSALPVGVPTFLGMIEGGGRQIILRAKRGDKQKNLMTIKQKFILLFAWIKQLIQIQTINPNSDNSFKFRQLIQIQTINQNSDNYIKFRQLIQIQTNNLNSDKLSKFRPII